MPRSAGPPAPHCPVSSLTLHTSRAALPVGLSYLRILTPAYRRGFQIRESQLVIRVRGHLPNKPRCYESRTVRHEQRLIQTARRNTSTFAKDAARCEYCRDSHDDITFHVAAVVEDTPVQFGA